jgi:putative glutamine amidotransferase
VARDGTLHQHLPDVVGERIAHRQQQSGPVSTHLVAVEQGSRLHHLLDRQLLQANSFHRQAVAALGRGLVVRKRAPDGTVESVNAEDGDFVVAVQWHAEYLTERPDQAALCTSS